MIMDEAALSGVLEKAIHDAISAQQHGRLMLLSVNDLPMIAEIYGQERVDELFIRLQSHIQALLGEVHQVIRVGKEDIAVIFSHCTLDVMENWVRQINMLIHQFGMKHAEIPVQLTANLGSVGFPAPAHSADAVIRKARVALNAVKQQLQGYHVAYEHIDKRVVQFKHQMILANYMQSALANGKVRLAFQPIISSKTGHVMYHESLLRLVGEDGKITSAGPFIPVAEKMGFVGVIDDLVLEMVIAELEQSPELMLSFNISNMTVTDEKWLAKAQHLMRDPALASRVVVEMTETAIHDDLKKVSRFVGALQDLGCQIAIDDFGAGYTSFRQLKALPVDIVKIDGYFIKDIMDNPDNRLFVKTLLDFAKGLGLKAVAEFVETGEIAKLLMELKVDYMQGNYFCPAVNYRSWVKDA